MRALCIALAVLHLAYSECATANEHPPKPLAAADLVSLRDLDGLSATPDGDWIAFQIREADPVANRYAQSWYVVSSDGKTLRRIAEGGEPIQPTYLGRINGIIRSPPAIWSTDGQWITYLRKHRSQVKVWRSHRDGLIGDELLTAHHDRVREFAYSKDGERLLYRAVASAHDIDVARQREGRTGFLYDDRFFPDYDRSPVFQDRELPSPGQWVVRLRDRASRRATVAEESELTSLLAASRSEPPPVHRTNEGDLVSCVELGQRELACFRESPNHPRILVAVDRQTNAVRTLYDPNPRFAEFSLGPPPQRLTFRTASGTETYGYLVLPPTSGGKPLPLIIITYRCRGFLRGGTGDEYPIFPFAAERFAVLCLDLPISDPARRAELGDGFQNWARGEGDPIKHRIQESLDSAVDLLAERGLIDRNRVAITGLSYGAETVMFALFRMKRLHAAIASGAEIGPASTFLYSRGGSADLRAWGLGSPYSDRWRRLSITHNAEKVRAPVLLNVADRELVSALPVVVALEDANRAVEMFVYPDEYHWKWQPAHRLAIYSRNIDWMNFWLQGREDPAPAKADQYRRWRAMRAKQCELFKGADAPWYCRS